MTCEQAAYIMNPELAAFSKRDFSCPHWPTAQSSFNTKIGTCSKYKDLSKQQAIPALRVGETRIRYLVVRALEKQLSFKSDDTTLFGSFQRSHQRLQRLLAFVVIEYGSKGALKLTCKNSQVKKLKHKMQVVRNINAMSGEPLSFRLLRRSKNLRRCAHSWATVSSFIQQQIKLNHLRGQAVK